MSHWECGPAFPLEEWLGQQKSIPTREYHLRECWVWKRLVKGMSLVEELDPQMDLELASSETQAWVQGQNSDAMEIPSSW